MSKRKMVQANLIKNSISAYYAAVEIHNKPNISYRYETVTLLIINAWELALKAFVRKYIKGKSIYTKDGHTISVDKALGDVNEFINAQKKGKFLAIKCNIEEIETYRNNVTHFYCDKLEPYVFMLVAKSALNYVEFMKEYFSRDIMMDDGLFIMPLGFKLPFRPEEFLSKNVAKYAASVEAQEFIDSIVDVIKKLDAEGVDDSIVLGFDLYFENIKKVNNKSIIAAISNKEEADVVFGKTTAYRFSKDSNNIVNMNDEEFRSIWKYSHADLLAWCRSNIEGFKQDKIFNAAKKSVLNNENYVYERKLDSTNPKSSSMKFYTQEGLEAIKRYYLDHKSTVPQQF